MRLAMILALCSLMVAGCTSVDVQVEMPDDILAFYQENPMPMPNLFSDPTTIAGDSGFPEDICITVSNYLISEYRPDVYTTDFLMSNTKVYVDWQLIHELSFYQYASGGLDPSTFVCLDTGSSSGYHLATVEVELSAETKISYTWVFEVP